MYLALQTKNYHISHDRGHMRTIVASGLVEQAENLGRVPSSP